MTHPSTIKARALLARLKQPSAADQGCNARSNADLAAAEAWAMNSPPHLDRRSLNAWLQQMPQVDDTPIAHVQRDTSDLPLVRKVRENAVVEPSRDDNELGAVIRYVDDCITNVVDDAVEILSEHRRELEQLRERVTQLDLQLDFAPDRARKEQ